MEPLQVTPKNGQVRYRASFFPPNYNLVINETAAGLAGKLAGVFRLKSSNIVFNQNALSTQYISFRYFLPTEPLRYLDVSIGVDQAEVVFVNPATASEFKIELLKLWEAIIEKSTPSISEHYFEAALHSTTEGTSAKEFLNKFVTIGGDGDIQRGFSLAIKEPAIEGEARMSFELSASIPDGLYVLFGCVSKQKAENIVALENLIEGTLNAYRKLQPLAQIKIVEAV